MGVTFDIEKDGVSSLSADEHINTLNSFHYSLPMPSIFVLGVTGYIGGSILTGYKKTYPDYEYVALVRSESGIPAVEGMYLSSERLSF